MTQNPEKIPLSVINSNLLYGKNTKDFLDQVITPLEHAQEDDLVGIGITIRVPSRNDSPYYAGYAHPYVKTKSGISYFPNYTSLPQKTRDPFAKAAALLMQCNLNEDRICELCEDMLNRDGYDQNITILYMGKARALLSDNISDMEFDEDIDSSKYFALVLPKTETAHEKMQVMNEYSNDIKETLLIIESVIGPAFCITQDEN